VTYISRGEGGGEKKTSIGVSAANGGRTRPRSLDPLRLVGTEKQDQAREKEIKGKADGPQTSDILEKIADVKGDC